MAGEVRIDLSEVLTIEPGDPREPARVHFCDGGSVVVGASGAERLRTDLAAYRAGQLGRPSGAVTSGADTSGADTSRPSRVVRLFGGPVAFARPALSEFDRWRRMATAGLRRLLRRGVLDPIADSDQLASDAAEARAIVQHRRLVADVANGPGASTRAWARQRESAQVWPMETGRAPARDTVDGEVLGVLGELHAGRLRRAGQRIEL